MGFCIGSAFRPLGFISTWYRMDGVLVWVFCGSSWCMKLLEGFWTGFVKLGKSSCNIGVKIDISHRYLFPDIHFGTMPNWDSVGNSKWMYKDVPKLLQIMDNYLNSVSCASAVFRATRKHRDSKTLDIRETTNYPRFYSISTRQVHPYTQNFEIWVEHLQNLKVSFSFRRILLQYISACIPTNAVFSIPPPQTLLPNLSKKSNSSTGIECFREEKTKILHQPIVRLASSKTQL